MTLFVFALMLQQAAEPIPAEAANFAKKGQSYFAKSLLNDNQIF
ncbi:hypothetical protein [Roseimicrobium gellanilyticum]|nr:hypothetical protein [Roseimicrobium gellanilyticum]